MFRKRIVRVKNKQPRILSFPGVREQQDEAIKLHTIHHLIGNQTVQQFITTQSANQLPINKLALVRNKPFLNLNNERLSSQITLPKNYHNIYIMRKNTPETSKLKEKLTSGTTEEKKVETGIGTKEASLKSSATFNPGGDFKLDLGSVLDFSSFGLSYGARYNAKDWTGFIELKLGDKLRGMTSELLIAEDGSLTFNMGEKFVYETITFSQKLSAGEKKSGLTGSLTESLSIKNLFDVKGLEANAALKFGIFDPLFSATAGAEYTVYEGREGYPIPTITIGGQLSFETGSGRTDQFNTTIFLKFMSPSHKTK